MDKRFYYFTCLVIVLSQISLSYADGPVLNFSDITSGPDIGLNDGNGSGAIVTVWGNNLGASQSDSNIEFCDSRSTCRTAYVYYWKNADGALPGGPSDLFASHNMQEIAISIPDSEPGDGTIRVSVNGQSSTLPFRVSEVGSIYWIAPGGRNNNNCSYDSPCAYINADINSGQNGGIANGHLSAGDIVYSRGVNEPEFCGGGRCVSLFTRSINGTEDDPISFIAYPNTQPTAIAEDTGLDPYLSTYINISKFTMKVGATDPALPANPGNSADSDIHIKAARGRYVGNYLGQIDGTCITGWGGAITSGGYGGEGTKVYGNEISNLGCSNTSRFHHTTYFSVRNSSVTLTKAWDISWNYLHDNFPMFGIHSYDENLSGTTIARVQGEIRITNNVITNQVGPGINISTRNYPEWEADILIENNILKNVGLGNRLDDNVTPNPSAISVGGAINPGKITIRNNTIYEWGNTETISANGQAYGLKLGYYSTGNPLVIIDNNIFKSNVDYPYFSSSRTVDEANNNLFYTSAINPTNDSKPEWTNNVLADPMLTFSGVKILINQNSPVKDAGVSNNLTHDIYGTSRINTDIGAVEYPIRPNPPTSVNVN